MKMFMKTIIRRRLLALWSGCISTLLAGLPAPGQTTTLSDNYNVANVGSGFALGQGVNSGINPPVTRLTGMAAANLRYMRTDGTKPDSVYTIGSNRLRVGTDGNIGRFSLSADGSTMYNFAGDLGTAGASPTDPAVYELRISMRNDATSTARFSFALATGEADANNWDFGVQLYRTNANDSYYQVQRRIHTGSSGVATNINAVMAITGPNTTNSLIPILIRVTDAGAESGTNYNSRVQVSLDNGATWIYDTSTDSQLPNGWRLDGPGRYILFDQAGNNSGPVFYDNLSVTSIYAPPPPPTRVWTGAGADNNWSSGGNWDGTAPGSGEPLLFGLSARQTNYNDLAGLTTPFLTFTNSGFALEGSMLGIGYAISNLFGLNRLLLPVNWPTAGAKSWWIETGSELALEGGVTVNSTGDHVVSGGGCLRLRGTTDINLTPPFIINAGQLIVDGGTFNSYGGFRIGSQAGATGLVQTVLSNGGALNLRVNTANLRVGDSSGTTSRLVINNGTLILMGGRLCIPYATGSTGEVAQIGGLVKDAYVVFSDSGAGVGTYCLTNGTLEPFQIRRDFAGGSAVLRFHNAVLRPAAGAVANFFSGLDLAEIQSGGLTLDATADIAIAQSLGGVGSLTKVGFGTATLTGTNTYGGATLVQEGKLVLPTTQTNAAPIQVSGGTEFGVTRPVADATLTAGSLSLSSCTLSFDLGAWGNPRAPLVSVNSLTASGGAGSVTINVSGGPGLTVGPITLVDFSGSIGGSGFSAFTLGTLPPGVSATLVHNVANSSIDLNITAAPGLRWTGANGSAWDYSTVNWFDEGLGANSTYSDGQPTRFFDGAATGIVDLTATFMPASLTVSNSFLNYVWGGFGSLSVPKLVKNGPANLTRVDGGADAIPEIELNAGMYVSSNTVDATFASVLTDITAGLGTFVKTGPGVLSVTSSNGTFDGTIVIREGVLKLGNAGALGTTNGVTIITNSGTLDLNNFIAPHQPVMVSGNGVNGVGAIIDSTTATGVAHNLTDVTLAGDTTFGCPNGGRWDLRVRSSSGLGPGLRGNGFNLTKVGSGLVSVACQRHFGAETPYWQLNLGDVIIREGTLAFAESLGLGNPEKTLIVWPGAALQLYDLGITNPMTRTIHFTNAWLNGHGGSAGTNVINAPISLTGSNNIALNLATTIINGPISGSGSVTIALEGTSASGILLLNGTNTYSGDTRLQSGTLGGTGSLAGNLLVLGGTIHPGAQGTPLGTLTVNGAAVLGGTTHMEIDRTRTPNCDRLVVGGALTFGGMLRVVLGPGAPAPQAGDVYQLFNKGGSDGFASVSFPALSDGLSWNTDELLTQGRISVTGLPTPPTIQSPHLSGGNLILTGRGGPANGSYAVLTSTNVAAPLTQWTTNVTGTFSASGTFSNAIPLNPGELHRFFLIKQP